MEVQEYLRYRKDLLVLAQDDDSFISEASFIDAVLPSMLDAKLIDSEEWNDTGFLSDTDKLKVNGYLINESEERLQLIILNEASIDIKVSDADLQISQKAYYEAQFSRTTRFLKKAINGHLNESLQDSDPVNALVAHLSSSEGADQFDVVDIFLISATATVETRGSIPQPKGLEFDNENLAVTYTKDRQRQSKEILIVKRLIDLNFLYDILISQGNREILTVNFESIFDAPIKAIKAAKEQNFESYLCVLPALHLAELYKLHSTRLLEKNVRSFLDFKNEANKGMFTTLRKDPAKFIAFNNGLTSTSTLSDTSEYGGLTLIRSLTDFQIVNGGQTTAAIYFARKSGIDISKVFVTAKINVVSEAAEDELNKFIKEISLYSNTQTKVTTVDLDSQNPQLVKLKALTASVVTPSGKKWFFDRAKGEFNTMKRKSGNKTKIEKEYPDERRFSKEQLGKYYSSWGDQPYMVKKGGIKVFKYFITAICGDGDKKKGVIVDRNFYEELIAKMILFNKLEKVYGAGKNSIGQLRSAVVPYSISILYKFTDGSKSGSTFDLTKIWVKEGLEDDLMLYMEDMMKLVNDLLKKYSDSDDVGENTRKKELWDKVSECREIATFMTTGNSQKILKKYSISNEERKKRNARNSKLAEVDFKPLEDNIEIYTNGTAFYDNVLTGYGKSLTVAEMNKLGIIKSSISNLENIKDTHVEFEKELIRRIRADAPELFDRKVNNEVVFWQQIFDFIVQIYNNAISEGEDVAAAFNRVQEFAKSKTIKYSSVFGQIGELLKNGDTPTVKQVWYASHILALKEHTSLVTQS